MPLGVSSSSTSEKPFSAAPPDNALWAGTSCFASGIFGGLFEVADRVADPWHFESWLLQKVYPLIRPMFGRFYLVIQTEQQQWGVYIHFDSTTMSQHETSWSQAPKWSPNILIDTNGSAFETFLSSIFGNFQKGSWTRNRIEMKLHLVSYVRNSLKKTHYLEPMFFEKGPKEQSKHIYVNIHWKPGIFWLFQRAICNKDWSSKFTSLSRTYHLLGAFRSIFFAVVFYFRNPSDSDKTKIESRKIDTSVVFLFHPMWQP